MSRRNGARPAVGTATAIGLVPRRRSAPPNAGDVVRAADRCREPRHAGVHHGLKVERERAGVVVCAQADPADPGVLRLGDRGAGGQMHREVAEAVVAVDQRRPPVSGGRSEALPLPWFRRREAGRRTGAGETRHGSRTRRGPRPPSSRRRRVRHPPGRRGSPARRATKPVSAAGSIRLASAESFIDDGVRQRADPFDLDLDGVAGLHPELRLARVADARGRAGRDDVASLQRHHLGDDRDDPRQP